MPAFWPALRRLLLGLVTLAATACAPNYPGDGVVPVGEWAAPEGMSAQAWANGLMAHQHATLAGYTVSPLLTIIDYSLPSTARRLWVVDLSTGAVLASEYVAHGSRSGGTYAVAFSNRDGSNQSSLGTFVTGSRSYSGVRGIAVRLKGLEPGINDRAWQRALVIHGTPNVSESRARHGQLGRSQGCPAVSVEAARRIVPLIEGGSVVFAWYPDPAFMARSDFVDPIALRLLRNTAARDIEDATHGAGS